MFTKNKLGKKSFAVLGMAAISMAAMTPVYAAEVPETKNTTETVGSVVPISSVEKTTGDTANVSNIWGEVYKEFQLEPGKLYTKDSTGKLVKLSDEQARAVNPLHDINVQRQSLIMDSLASGEWHTYYAFEATQAPLHYDLNEEGKIVPNKNFYANLVESSHRSMVEAKNKGDKELEEIMAKDLKQTIEKYNAAPGMSVYISQVNSNEKDSEFYGIQMPDAEYFDSEFNNYDVRTKGYAGSKYWYENDYFLDNPEIFVEIVKSIGVYTKMSAQDIYTITTGYDKAVDEKNKAKKDKAEKDKAEKDKAVAQNVIADSETSTLITE